MKSYTQKQLEDMSLEDFAKALAMCLADEVTYIGDDQAAEASQLVLSVAAERLGIADELADVSIP